MCKFAYPAMLVLLMLAGCSDGVSEPGPGGVSAEDAQALDEAASRLDSQASSEAIPKASK